MVNPCQRRCREILGAIVCVVICAQVAWSQGWVQTTSTLPRTREHARLIFDERVNEFVLFGGNSNIGTSTSPVADTWVWDGAWRFVAGGDSPVGVLYPGAAYDRKNGEVVRFGGRSEYGSKGVFSGETHVWRNREWVRLDVPGPPARYRHLMAYDPVDERVLVWGGWSHNDGPDGELFDTWSWDGQSWSQLGDTGSIPMGRFVAAWDSIGQRLIAVGHRGSTNEPSETYAWDGAGWVLVGDAGPTGVSERDAIATHPDGGVMLTEGEVRWDGTAWVLDEVDRPIGDGASVAYNPTENSLLVVNASSRNTDPYLCVSYKDGEWSAVGSEASLVSSSGNVFSYTTTFVYDEANRCPVYFESLYGSSGPMTTRVWDGASWLWPRVKQPPVRGGHCMVFDRTSQRVLLFGGLDADGQALDDTWVWDGETWTELEVPGPPPMFDHEMAFDETSGRVILFGGAFQSSPWVLSDQTWAWTGQAWEQLEVSGPSPRLRANMGFDPKSGVLLMAGGSVWVDDGGTSLTLGTSEKTWVWDGSGWSLHEATVPLNNFPFPRPLNLEFYYDTVMKELLGYVNIDTHAERYRLGASSWESLGRFLDYGQSRIIYDTDTDTSISFAMVYDKMGLFYRRINGVWHEQKIGPAYDVLPGNSVFDEARGRTVLFARSAYQEWGIGATDQPVWYWKNRAYRQSFATAPEFSGGDLAYHSGDGSFLALHKRESVATWYDTECLWDGEEWSFPWAQGDYLYTYRESIEYHPPTDSFVAFGRADPNWTYVRTGGIWTRSDASSPPAREYPEMIFDPVTGKIILIGGTIKSVLAKDTWLWDGEGWEFGGDLPSWPLGGDVVYERLRLFRDPYTDRVSLLSLATVEGMEGTQGRIWVWEENRWRPRLNLPTLPASYVFTDWIDPIAGDLVCNGSQYNTDRTSFQRALWVLRLPCSPADILADGVLDLGDVQAFVRGFLEGLPNCDINIDGVLDIGDIGFFVDEFLAGC